MSLPEEEKHALEQTKNFLFDLLDPKKTPRVPRDVRKRASRCLKHYPIVIDFFIERCIMDKQDN